jgi:hypothetical protein
MVEDMELGDSMENLKPYKVDIASILADNNMDRPIKDIASENLELKNEVYCLQNRLTASREMIEKYTLRQDELLDESQVSRTRAVKARIQDLVNDIKAQKAKTKKMKETIIDLQAKLEEKKVEVSMNLLKVRDELAAKEREE